MLGAYVFAISISAIVFCLLVIAHKVLLGVWAYLDAKERGMSGDVGWGFAVALVPIYIGLIIYLAVRSDETRRNVCPACSRSNPQDAKFCSLCGAAIESAPVVLPQNRKSRGVLVAFFICLGAAILLFIAMIASSIAFSLRFVDQVFPRMGDYFHEWRIDPNLPGFQFDFHIGDGNNT